MLRIFKAFSLIGALLFGTFFQSEFARSADTVRVDSFNFHSGSSDYRAEGVEFEGLNLSPEGLEALIHGSDLALQTKALSSLDASIIRVSRLRQSQTIGTQTSTTILSNVVLSDIKAGIVRVFSAEKITFGATGGADATSSGSGSNVLLEEVDLALLAGIGATSKSAKSADFKRAYRLARVEKIAVQGANSTTTTINKVEIRDAQVKETGDGFAAITERLAKRGASPQPSNDTDVAATLNDVIDLISSVSTGYFEIDDLAVRAPETPRSFGSLSRLVYTGGTDTQTSGYRLEGLDLAMEDTHLKVGRFSHNGIKLAPLFAALKSTLSKPKAQPSDIDPMIFLQLVGKMELNDVSVDADYSGPQHSGIGTLMIAVDSTPEGLPIASEISFDKLYGPLPAGSTEPAVQTLIGLGYHDLNLSGSVKMALEPKAQELNLTTNLSAENMAVVTLAGRFGNVSAENIFSNSNSAPLLLLGASLKNFAFSVENRGIGDRLIDQQAITTKRSAQQVRGDYASAAAVSLQIYLGMSPNAKAVTRSIVRFIEKPTKFNVVGQSKNPAGVTLADTANGDGPAAILDLFELQLGP